MHWAFLISEGATSPADITALQWITIGIAAIGCYVMAYIVIYMVYVVRKFMKKRKRKKEQEE